MTSAEDLHEILCDRNRRSRTIAAGAVNYLKQWSAVPIRGDLFNAILAGCLVCLAFIVLALVPAILALQAPASNAACRRGLLGASFDSVDDGSSNVYFVKHENRTWSDEELCHIEQAARRYPDYNVFVIDLRDRVGDDDADAYNCGGSLDDYILFEANSRNLEEGGNSLRSIKLDLANVARIDVAIDKLFAGSMLSCKKVKDLDIDRIETAAKFQIIWDLPGIALEPFDIRHLESIRRHFNERHVDTSASVIGLDNDLQASRVSCQTFIGLVVREMAKTPSDFTDRRSLLERVLRKFCPSGTADCDGVRVIVDGSSAAMDSTRDFTTCPIVHSHVMASDDS